MSFISRSLPMLEELAGPAAGAGALLGLYGASQLPGHTRVEDLNWEAVRVELRKKIEALRDAGLDDEANAAEDVLAELDQEKREPPTSHGGSLDLRSRSGDEPYNKPEHTCKQTDKS